MFSLVGRHAPLVLQTSKGRAGSSPVNFVKLKFKGEIEYEDLGTYRCFGSS